MIDTQGLSDMTPSSPDVPTSLLSAKPLQSSAIPLSPNTTPPAPNPGLSNPNQNPTPQTLSTPPPSPVTSPIVTPPPAPSGNVKKILIILLLLVLLAGGGFIGVSLADAYGTLPFTTPFTKTVGNTLIATLPLPKTPQMVIDRSIQAHRDVTSAEFTASLATKSDSILDVLGTSDLDIQATGMIDWADIEHPSVEVNLNVSDQFTGDLILLSKDLYVQLTKLPPVLLGYLVGTTSADTSQIETLLLNQWIYAPGSDLQTEARDNLESSSTDTPFDEAYQKTRDSLYSDTILPKLTMTTEDKDGDPIYHLSITLEGSDIDTIVDTFQNNLPPEDQPDNTSDSKPSDSIKRLQMDWYIHRSTYYLHTASLIIDADNQTLIEQNNTSPYTAGNILQPEIYHIALSVNLRHVGEPVRITAPDDYMSVEDFMVQARQALTPSQDQLEEMQLDEGMSDEEILEMMNQITPPAQ